MFSIRSETQMKQINSSYLKRVCQSALAAPLLVYIVYIKQVSKLGVQSKAINGRFRAEKEAEMVFEGCVVNGEAK